MSLTDIITLVVACEALVTSCVSAYEMLCQSKTAVRPVVVVLEKFTANANPEGEGRLLYMINMGNSMAINVRFHWNHETVLAEAGNFVERPFRKR